MDTANATTILNLRKDYILNLKKTAGLRGFVAAVEFCLDYSGSMNTLYRNGSMQKLIDRILPLGLAFDDNKSVGMKLFHHGFIDGLPDITMDNYKNYIQREILDKRWDMGSTNYAPVLNEIIKQHTGVDILNKTAITPSKGLFGGLFGGKKENNNPATTTPKALRNPVYVIFVTDGNCDDRENTERVIREASKYGVFFQFVGIGSASFLFLEKLDTLSGRVIDNAGFFDVLDLDKIEDDELYNRIMKEFPTWISDAQKQALITG